MRTRRWLEGTFSPGLYNAYCAGTPPSFEGLEDAARRGCDICSLVLGCFKGAPIVDDEIPLFWPEDWADEEYWGPEASMHIITKYLQTSSVHFDIGASHVYSGGFLTDVRQFDLLLVQVGDKEEDTCWGTMEWEMPTLSLAAMCRHLTTRNADEAFFIDDFRIGRNELVPDLAAPENFEIARQWLKSCFQEHDGCPANCPRVLPTRVVDVGVAPDFGDVKIASPQGAKSDCLTLSHCWGGKVTPLLTQETVESFSSSLPTHESIKMAQIYRDSVLTISAICSSGSTKGILRNTEKKPLPPQPKPVFMTLAGSGSGHKVTIARDRKGESLIECDLLAPPARLPGRRGKQPRRSLSLELSLETIAADLYGDILKHKPPAEDADSSTGGATIQSIRREYYIIAEKYSRRALTFGSDKLPAFSGIARRLHHVAFGGGDYLAGIWAVDLPSGLPWEAEGDKGEYASDSVRQPLSSLELLASDMRLCDAADPYGQVCSGSSITVRGQVCTLRRSEQVLDGGMWSNPSLGWMKIDEEWSSDASLVLPLSGDELLCITVRDGEMQVGGLNGVWAWSCNRWGMQQREEAMNTKGFVQTVGVTDCNGLAQSLPRVRGLKESIFRVKRRRKRWAPPRSRGAVLGAATMGPHKKRKFPQEAPSLQAPPYFKGTAFD
ncbi:hypothetical protein MAPG_03643 [Magnaporthiopsis poae ATCC 64411]|uniref:Heterokaryon incompatibility domain-containing protein n=1 Tax=Magnaporthiopsis poae (strain ATCC 64411 / 73-15) TaxID=644358 RepID=A0A0C4DUK3_MAGP6|nr:hypothetical protein MAPG_03643 [Magnaporthiopsis poae ATCC 64411]